MAEQEVPILSRLKPPAGAVRKRRRVGRGPGSGLGKTSGKGQKGQKSRGKGKVARGFEGGQTPLQRRLPKYGFKNPFSKKVSTVNVGSLARFEAGAVVDPDALAKAGLIGKQHDGVKILGEGTLELKLTVRAHAFSKNARALIEKAGGTAEVIEAKPQAAEAAAEA